MNLAYFPLIFGYILDYIRFSFFEKCEHVFMFIIILSYEVRLKTEFAREIPEQHKRRKLVRKRLLTQD